MNLQPHDAVHYDCGWSQLWLLIFLKGQRQSPSPADSGDSGQQESLPEAEWWTQMHCSKTPTATGHLPARDVETDHGPWVPHIGYVQTGK